jgi:hypothetical protein
MHGTGQDRAIPGGGVVWVGGGGVGAMLCQVACTLQL